MSGVHIIGPAGYHITVLRKWASNGLQAVTHVKPEPDDGALLRGILGPKATMVGRITNGTDLTDSKIQQRYEADPAKEAKNLVDRSKATIALNPEYNAWQFDNERVFGDGDRLAGIKKHVAFIRELIDICTPLGIGVAFNCFARGTPEPGEWKHYYEVWRYALSRNAELQEINPNAEHTASFHQYGSFNASGPGSLLQDKEWHIERFEHQVRPFLAADLKNAKYLITESGPDGGQHELRGWQQVYGQNDAGRAALCKDWKMYNEWLAQQAGCLGACFFTLGQEGGFGTFDISGDPVAMMLASQTYPKLKPAIVTPPTGGGGTGGGNTGGGGGTTPPTTPPSPPTNETLTQKFIRLARAEFGDKFEDLRASLPKHKTLRFSAIDSRRMQYLCFHHSATERERSWQNIAAYHVNTHGWAGVGYHLGIRLGKLALLGDLDTQRAHVKDRNNEALGLCVTGNYDMYGVAAQDVDIMRRAVKVLDQLYQPDKVLTDHGTMLPHYTECPGDTLHAILPTLRTSPYDHATVIKWVYFLQVAARAARGEGYQAAHDLIMNAVLPPILNLRDGTSLSVGTLDGYTKIAYEKAAYWMEEVARRARAEGLQKVHDAIMGVSHPPVAARRDGGA